MSWLRWILLALVAGGLGMAPLRSLLGYALDLRERFGEVTLMHGARSPREMLFREEMTALAARADVRCLLTVDRDPALYVEEVEAESRDLANQLLFAYKINPQTVVFAGYSDSLRDDPAGDLVRDARTFFVKLGYAWRG